MRTIVTFTKLYKSVTFLFYLEQCNRRIYNIKVSIQDSNNFTDTRGKLLMKHINIISVTYIVFFILEADKIIYFTSEPEVADPF